MQFYPVPPIFRKQTPHNRINEQGNSLLFMPQMSTPLFFTHILHKGEWESSVLDQHVNACYFQLKLNAQKGDTSMSNTIDKFLGLLNTASAVTVDDGAMLTDIVAEKLTGDPDNQVVRFTWTDGEFDYADILTESGIAQGVFDSDGKFVAENIDGEKTVIRFFAVERLNDVSSKHAAAMFFQELLDSVETLTGIAVEHGSRTLADLMYLQNAILSGGFIDHYPDESKVLEIVSAMPSGDQWSKFIKVEYLASST